MLIFHEEDAILQWKLSTVRLERRLACERHTKENEVSGAAIVLVVLGRSFLVAAS